MVKAAATPVVVAAEVKNPSSSTRYVVLAAAVKVMPVQLASVTVLLELSAAKVTIVGAPAPDGPAGITMSPLPNKDVLLTVLMLVAETRVACLPVRAVSRPVMVLVA
jgi:hypothetical protein